MSQLPRLFSSNKNLLQLKETPSPLNSFGVGSVPKMSRKSSKMSFKTNDSNISLKSTKAGKSPSIMSMLSSGSISQFDLASDQETRVVTVKLFSNWGDLKEIRCSSILLLDEARLPIPVIQVSSVPSLPQATLSSLFDRVLVKTSSKDIFSAPWPSSDYDSISIIFIIASTAKPRYLRVWNPNDRPKTSVKSLSVLMGSKVCATGEIPEGFGIDVQLALTQDIQASTSIAILAELFPQFAPEKSIYDKYGAFPIAKAKSLTIDVLSNWGDDVYFGFNYINIYNEDNSPIPWSEIEFVHIYNCLNYSDPSMLFKERVDNIDFTTMFIGEGRWSTGKPSIQISFKQAVKVTAVEIMNFNAHNRSLKIGIKDIKIKNGQRLIWLGRIKQGVAKLQSLDLSKTSIWFTDDPTYTNRNIIML